MATATTTSAAAESSTTYAGHAHAQTGGRGFVDGMAGIAAADRVVAAMVGGVRADELSDEQLVARLEAVERIGRRIDAHRVELVTALSDRRARRASDVGGDARQKKARRDTERELARRLRRREGEVKKDVDTGRKVQRSHAAQAAFAAGDIGAEHAQVIGDTVRHLLGDQRRQAERHLLDAARTHNARELGRIARDLLARLAPQAASREEDRRHASRRATVSHTPDGNLEIHGRWAIVDGALITRAVDAFRRPDRSTECRTPEQATADAITDLCRAALGEVSGHDDDSGHHSGERGSRRARRASNAGTSHGVRPHVVVTVSLDALTSGDPLATVDLDGQTVTLDQIRHLLDDAGWSFVLTDHRGIPTAVTDEVRTVPAGLWRALTLRDGGCIADECDRKADWCDVMHLRVPYCNGGKLSLDTAALGCRAHHRAYDAGHLSLHWRDGRPALRRQPTGVRDGPSP